MKRWTGTAAQNGQYSIFDYIGDTRYRIDSKPCAFDRIDAIVLDEMVMDQGMVEYDPEEGA